MVLVLIMFSACEDNEYAVSSEYENADISAIECYDVANVRADSLTDIATPTKLIITKLKKGEDITKLKVNVTISAGATITPALSIGYQDYTEPKVYKVTSPGGTVVKEWTIMVYATK